MLTDMGYSQDQAAGIVASGNVDTLLNAAVKQKFSGAGGTAKMQNIRYLESLGYSTEEAVAMEYQRTQAGAGAGGKEVKSSEYVPGTGIVQILYKDGSQEYKEGGRVLGIDELNERIKEAQDRKVALATEEESAKRFGQLRAERVEFAVNKIDNLESELRLLDRLESLYEREGENFNPNTWFQRNLPTVSSAAAEFDQIMGQFGLGVVSSVTFGALSEGELNLAMRTAFPASGSREETLAYAKRKKDATTKLMNEMRRMARFFENGGTQAEWYDMQAEIRDLRTGEPPAKYFDDVGVDDGTISREDAQKFWRNRMTHEERKNYE